VYLRQSSAAPVEHNRESTERQHRLAIKARELGWPEDRIVIIRFRLGRAIGLCPPHVALGLVCLVLGLEVSRLALNNADWVDAILSAVLQDRSPRR
jgi:hypothetical protein